MLVVNTVEATPRWNLNKGVSQTVGARSGGGSAGDIQAEDLGAVRGGVDVHESSSRNGEVERSRLAQESAVIRR